MELAEATKVLKSAADAEYYQRTRTKRLAYTRGYNRNNPRKRLKHRLAKFGLTVEQYDAMLDAQEHLCALCRQPNQGQRRWHVDHDHKTGVVRGLLCNLCNVGLGMFQDNIEKLKAAIAYLERTCAGCVRKNS